LITRENLEDVLKSIGYIKNGDIYKKEYPESDCSLIVDFKKEEIVYPEDKGLKVSRKTICNFSDPENFVVLECITRLLDKKYRPEHIEIEKGWTLGHARKGGYSDILVVDELGKTLFIIECKTAGIKYGKAIKDTKNDGAQLFSYWQQEQSCEWLVLYSSDYDNGMIKHNVFTISCSDDANIVLLANKNSSLKLYRDAHTAKEKYNVWKETYQKQVLDDLIFSDDSVAYNIGVKPLLKKDLKDFSPDDKTVNRFEEILRHNNISDRENAFNRLIALFICKLVDEITKTENDEVEFQYRQGFDTYETLQDRLQRLHRDGMEKFMKEKIYYIPADYPERLFLNYTGTQRKQAIEDLQNTIRTLKFYSNNDFAFKDVHNEELFYQNGKILVEMVQLFEKYRIVYPSKHQFLGDLFEQLLNKGFKQNEGQFFTPMPISRFIWDSLPVARMVKASYGSVYPKIIDYACGAGHFLTEAVEAINYYSKNTDDNTWTRDSIFGIEKDYRLARVSKISLFMNGAGESNIIFGDGLDNAKDKGIENGMFDILVANPPYSIKDFKQHLKLDDNTFTLLDRIGLNGGEIETLFVERIGQLLKPKGVAAVILPSSILSNDNTSYVGAREQLLQNFYIRAIVSLGSKTFGATGTNTVILFLEKYNEPPKQIDLLKDSIDSIFNNGSLSDWDDEKILKAYIKQIGVTKTEYKRFLNKKYSLVDFESNEYFKIYVASFVKSVDVKSLQKTKAYKAKNRIEQSKAYLATFYDYVLSIEKEKLFYFSLVYRQKTVVVISPEDNKGQRDFLGYDWSTRKGNEGIQIITPGGKMYAPENREAKGTLANAISDSFLGLVPSFSAEQQKYSYVAETKNMLDFSASSFNKIIKLQKYDEMKLKSKYPLHQLGEVCNVIIGGTPSRRNPQYFSGDKLWVSVAELNGQIITDTKEKITEDAVSDSNVKLIPKGTTLLSFKLSIGKTAIAGQDLYTNEAVASLVPIVPSELLDKYIYFFFTGKLVNLTNVGSKAFGRSLNSTFLKEKVMIPFPPINIQKQVIDECEKIQEEYEKVRMTDEDYRQKIKDVFMGLEIVLK